MRVKCRLQGFFMRKNNKIEKVEIIFFISRSMVFRTHEIYYYFLKGSCVNIASSFLLASSNNASLRVVISSSPK